MNQLQQGIIWLLAHVAIGLAAHDLPMVPAAWLATLVGLAVLFSLRDRNKHGYLHLAACYLCGFEVLTRMVDAPVPWESGRYIGIPLLLLGVLMNRSMKKMLPGILLIACIIPSLALTDFTRDVRNTLVFNWAGALTLGLSVMYFNRRVLMENDVLWILRALAGPVVALAVASVVRAPDLAEVSFSLKSSHAAVGFGPNQMATVFGMGVVALSLGFLMNRPVFGHAGVDALVIAYVFYRGLISFSRGGLTSAIIAALGATALIVWAHMRGQRLGQTVRLRKLVAVPMIACFLGVIFLATNQVTGGTLLLRYKGETDGTHSGSREKSLVTFTSGRSEIVRTDLAMWYDHPILGVGPGNSAKLRPKYGYWSVAAHTEFSRLVAEHGIFGMLFVLAAGYFPLRTALDSRQPVFGRVIMVAFSLFSLTVMAHSATRLFGTTMVYGIGWALIVPRDVLVRIAFNHPELRHRVLSLLNFGNPRAVGATRG